MHRVRERLNQINVSEIIIHMLAPTGQASITSATHGAASTDVGLKHILGLGGQLVHVRRYEKTPKFAWSAFEEYFLVVAPSYGTMAESLGSRGVARTCRPTCWRCWTFSRRTTSNTCGSSRHRPAGTSASTATCRPTTASTRSSIFSR